jgi:hypothetical protein
MVTMCRSINSELIKAQTIHQEMSKGSVGIYSRSNKIVPIETQAMHAKITFINLQEISMTILKDILPKEMCPNKSREKEAIQFMTLGKQLMKKKKKIS